MDAKSTSNAPSELSRETVSCLRSIRLAVPALVILLAAAIITVACIGYFAAVANVVELLLEPAIVLLGFIMAVILAVIAMLLTLLTSDYSKNNFDQSSNGSDASGKNPPQH